MIWMTAPSRNKREVRIDLCETCHCRCDVFGDFSESTESRDTIVERGNFRETRGIALATEPKEGADG